MGRADLAKLHGLNHVTIRQRLQVAGVKNGDDVSAIDLSRKQFLKNNK